MERENKIYASSIRGYCSVETCWQFIYDISSQMEVLHAQGKSFGEIDLKYIEVNGVQFRHVGEPCACCDVYGDTWKLAAAAYELLLGIPVLNGLGERSQTAQTPLPSLSGSDAEPLNRLLHGCMNYKKTERPKAGDIKSIACEELKTFAKPSRKPRVYSNENNTVQPGKYDKSWPESMIALLVSLLLLVTGSVQAQDYINARDEENTMKLRLVKLSKEYQSQLFEMMEEWTNAGGKSDLLTTAETVTEAHETLVEADSSNEAKFSQVIEFAKKDVERLKNDK